MFSITVEISMAGSDKDVQIWRILKLMNKIIIIKAILVWNSFLKDEKENVKHWENLIFWPCYLAFQYNNNLKIL